MKKNAEKKVLSVIIPLYNEEEFICTLLDKVAQAKVTVSMEILIVNDGSTDQSGILCQQWIRDHQECFPHRFVYLEKPNGGKGSAVKMGIAHSTGAVVIIQDADLEYDPADYEKCIRPILHGECSVVYGSREKENRNRLFSSPFFFLGGLFLTWWIDLLYNAELTDEPTCYKTFSGPLLRSIPLDGDQFDWEPEITAKLLRMGFEIREVPVSYYPRKTTQGKKIHFTDGFYAFWVALLWRFASLKTFREDTASVSGEFRNVIRQKKRQGLFLSGIFLLALLLRILIALPGLLSQDQKGLMYVDSYPFLAIAGKGMTRELPKLHTPYPSGFRQIRETGSVPRWKQIMNNQIKAPMYALYLSMTRNAAAAALGTCLLGALSCVFVFLAGCSLTKSWICGTIGGLLLALHPVSILYSSILLPDTLFVFLVTLQGWFLLRFMKNGFGLNLTASVVFAAFGALTDSGNFFWILPCIAVLFCCRKVPLRLRFNYMCLALLLFTVIILPFLWNNYRCGNGWRISSDASDKLLKNASTLEAAHRNVSVQKVRREYLTLLSQKYAKDPERFKTLGAQLAERDHVVLQKILKHPFAYLASHCNLKLFLQDLTGYFIRFRCSTPKSRMIWASVLQRLNQGFLLLLFLGLFWYFMALDTSGFAMKLLLFLVLAAYYLFLPGAVSESRHLLPALPFLCLASGFGLHYLYTLLREKRPPEGF